MNISKLNPIGYISTTKNGNDYKKSNVGKSVGLAAYVGEQVASIAFRNNKIVQSISGERFIKELSTIAEKDIPQKHVLPILLLAHAAELVFLVGIGALVDHLINKMRVAKVDRQAQIHSDTVSRIDKK